ncbi:cytochrome b-c1 complex subunit 2, mitochondrial [Planococcus citri]|uniref:cytochrome b-c1 complex subunit 2, mitochondrial n=1 Tax=Planococcus citri TaxID=170843 RepID=UPI0031F9865B
MSCSAGKHNVLRTIVKRSYASQPTPKNAVINSELKASTSTKGSRLIALNKNSPLLKVTLSYKVGPRYETPEYLGITHLIRAFTGLSTKNFTPFNIHRNLQQYGINLYATSDRESLSYTVETNQEQLDKALNYLTDVASYPAFKPWELKDYRHKVLTELSAISPEAKVVDLLHQAAYSNGLKNSLFCDESRIGNFSFEDFLQYFDDNFTYPRFQVTSNGLDLSFLEEYITAIELSETGGPSVTKSKYLGNEARLANYQENVAYIVVAGESPGVTQKEYLAYAVLKNIYGTPVPIKYGNSHGILSKALSKANLAAGVIGFNATYSDSGLTGFFMITDPDNAAAALKTVYTEFSKANITDSDVKRGKALLKNDLLRSAECSNIVDYIAKQVALDAVTTPDQVAAAIESVTTADVQQAAKKLASSKVASAYYGHIASSPSLNDL